MKCQSGWVESSIIIASLVIFELLFRTVSPLLSGNVKQIYEIQDVTDELAKDNDAILFLGNSLIGNALDLEQFDKQANLNLSSYKVVPDGTSLWDWSCIIKNNFVKNERSPKIVVLGFAWSQASPEPSRLGAFFCSANDLPELIHKGMDNSSDVIEFLVSKVSRLYAMREIIRNRIFDDLIPEYRFYTQKINAQRNQSRQQVIVQPQQKGSLLLDAYMKTLVDHGIKPVIIAMPVVQPYDIDDDFIRTINLYGGVFLDYRNLKGIDSSMYRDPIHLNERGNKVFTRQLSADFQGI